MITASTIITITSIVWLLAGIIEWLFVFGIMKEENPKAVTVLFRACAVLNLLIAYGLWHLMDWARLLGMVVVITQFVAHSWMIRREMPNPQFYRFIEIAMFIFYLLFFNQRSITVLFH